MQKLFHVYWGYRSRSAFIEANSFQEACGKVSDMTGQKLEFVKFPTFQDSYRAIAKNRYGYLENIFIEECVDDSEKLIFDFQQKVDPFHDYQQNA